MSYEFCRKGTHSLWVVDERVRLIIAVANINEILHPVLLLLLWAATLQTDRKRTRSQTFSSTHLQLWSYVQTCWNRNTHIFVFKLPGQLFDLPPLPVIISKRVAGVQRRSESFRESWTRVLYLQETRNETKEWGRRSDGLHRELIHTNRCEHHQWGTLQWF